MSVYNVQCRDDATNADSHWVGSTSDRVDLAVDREVTFRPITGRYHY